jgi:uncharacterized protein YggE
MRMLAARPMARTLMIAISAALSTGAAFGAEPQRTITVEGHGEVTAPPDSASVSAGVTTQAKTAAEALSANASAMNSVFAALKRMGVQDKNVQTSNFSVEPQYAPYNANEQDRQRIIGYQVSNQVNVMLDHVSNVGPAIDTLVAAGANQMNGISFMVHDPKPMMDQARTSAVEDAIAHAAVLTRAAHVSLGPIMSIEESTNPAPGPIRPMVMMKKAAGSTPIATGEEAISANVSITWAIQ